MKHGKISVQVMRVIMNVKTIMIERIVMKPQHTYGNTQTTIHVLPQPQPYEAIELVVPQPQHYETGEHVVKLADDEPKQEHVRQQVELKREHVVQQMELRQEQPHAS